MKNEISASNQAKVQYRLEGETYVFETNIEGGGEYALIFVNSDDSHYTAAVTRAGKTLIQKIEKKRIAAAVKIKIVDVETDAEIFTDLLSQRRRLTRNRIRKSRNRLRLSPAP
jgi:acyl CoA:acetate/3-ketoacid CoA transferase alpha subunit